MENNNSDSIAKNMVVDLRDAILSVLVKYDVCPMHWQVDKCPIEVYGRRANINSTYESEMSILRKKYIALLDERREQRIDERC